VGGIRSGLGHRRADGPGAVVPPGKVLGQCVGADQNRGQFARGSQDAGLTGKSLASHQLADLGLWDLGRVQALAGQKEEARKTFQRLLNQHPNSIYTSVAQQRLLSLGD
jgi:hypothetical protein